MRISEQIRDIKEHDMVLYARLKGGRPPLPRGCKTFLLEVFARAMILTQVVAEAGYAISEPTDYSRNGSDLLEPQGQKLIEDQIARDDPWLTTVSFPCGPWNPLTRFTMARYEHLHREYSELREKSRPMLDWIANLSAERIKRGRTVLVENGWRCDSLDQEEFKKLYEIQDPIIGEPFEFVSGDQCVHGKKDYESGVPIQAATAWGTTSECLKRRLGQTCKGDHEHQHVQGRNAFGLRSAQKAVWERELCVESFKSSVEELHLRQDWSAFPGVVIEEERLERGSLDEPDEEDLQTTVLVQYCLTSRRLNRRRWTSSSFQA